jgi:hypothetical protein
MLHFSGDESLREFWHAGPAGFGKATGTDLYVGATRSACSPP